ncbi:MAG TPA: DUF2628 domain-containing protein [Rhabdaerophilum sp.]|nr:DUF2628 domain-containing protein [Rhabdaerophilum sp.]
MARFTIHVPGDAPSREAGLERAVFVRDGWSWGAFLFGPFWLMAHRHWLTGLFALVGLGLVLAAIVALPVAAGAKAAVWLLIGWLFGIEGSSLRRLALRRAGYDEAGVIVGSAGEALEQRTFASLGTADAAAPARLATPSVLGLFPRAGK